MTSNDHKEDQVVGPVPEGLVAQDYDRLRRQLLWKLTTGLYLMGSGSGNEYCMMTVNQVVQVAKKPKIIVVGVEKQSMTYKLAVKAGCFSLAFLQKSQREIVRKFVKPPVHDLQQSTLSGYKYFLTPTVKSPVLEATPFYFELVVAKILEFDSHDALFGEIVNVGSMANIAELDPLLISDTRMNYGG